MTEDGSNDGYFAEYDDTSMEIFIETLTGASFEMTVSPGDTIASIKSKIQRVEGIPVSQQHLLYRMQELSNESCLSDHGVTAGSTLRLVLSMRGGPISTRRLASTEHHLAWREIKEYVDTTREDILDKLPPGSKVTVLLFREGEHINLIRVIENEDGTCYPFSDSWVPVTKTRTKEQSHAKNGERQAENNVMMRKVIELRRKMEGLSVQKKTRKPKTEENDHLPSTSGLNNEACASTSSQLELPKVPGEFASGKALSDLYTDRLLYIQQQRKHNNIGRSHRPYRVDTSLIAPKSETPSRNCAPTLQAPSIAILEEEPDTTHKKEPEFSPPGPISVPSGDANTVAMSQIPSLPGTSRNLVHLAHMAHLVLDDRTERPKTSPEKDPKPICNILLNETSERGVKISSRRQSVDFSRNYNQNLPKFSNLERSHPRERNYRESNEWTDYSYNRSNLLTSNYPSTSRLNSAHLDSLLGNRVENKYETKRSPLYGRRARIERIRNFDSSDKYGYNNLGYMANIEKIQNDSISKSPVYRRRNLLLEPKQDNCNRNVSERFLLEPKNVETRRNAHVTELLVEKVQLPSILPKKTRTRCAFCNKRLNITTIHTCRCGGIYCSQHRYSEVHGCQYDYKTEGRKILEQTNPLVAAPKLPKI